MEVKINRNTLIILILLVFTSMALTLVMLGKIMNAEKKNTTAATTLTNSKDDPINTETVEVKDEEEIICETKDIIHEFVEEPSQDDDIQDIIGYQNNKVGLYIYAEVDEFHEKADEMVNSNGGDWGYVLVPYNVKDYDIERWGKLFAKLNDKHLIPIIQLWDLDLDDAQKKEKQIQRFRRVS
jgi:hypothetical protein